MSLWTLNIFDNLNCIKSEFIVRLAKFKMNFSKNHLLALFFIKIPRVKQHKQG